jgi:two-component system CheB/CheR fusion protein
MSEAPGPDVQFENLLEYLRQNRGFDFTGYKRPSLMRRITKRMQLLDIESFPDYTDYLEVHPDEFATLFNSILINVTSFFRDPPAWKSLAEMVVPRILQNQDSEHIRIWSAGCASGEEAYTIAILMAEALGKDAFRQRVKIYATDVDDEALAMARQASYGAKEIAQVPEEFRKKYFDSVGLRYVFQADLRRSVIFGRHDLVQDAPMSKLDLLVCRNTLMYFNAETQSRILGRFNYALKPNGYLFLGKAEMLLVHSALFAPMDMRHRIFSKVAQVNMRDRLLVFAQTAGINADLNSHINRHVRLRDATFETGETAQVVVDQSGALILANQQARQLFGIEQRDIGRPFQDLEFSYRPVELRSLIEQAYAEKKSVVIGNVERRFNNGESHYFEVQVTPLQENDSAMGVSITFSDVTGYHKLEDEVLRARQDAETINEELQAANEELQSTNEELETMNEELQSTNEELQTINDELRVRTEDLNKSTAFLGSILSSLRGGVVVVDRNLSILIWNHMAEDLWGLRAEEVKGQSFLSLDIGLPVGQLRAPIRDCVNDGNEQQELVVNAVNRRGRSITCRVEITPFKSLSGERQGAVIMMEEMGM